MRLPPPWFALGLLLSGCVDPRIVEDHSGLGGSEIGRYFSHRDIDEGRDIDFDIQSMVLGHLRRSGGVLSSADQSQLGLSCESATQPMRCIYEGVDRVRDAPRLFEGRVPRRSNETTVHVGVTILSPADVTAHVTIHGRTDMTRTAPG